MECTKCGWKSIKYHWIGWKIPICNVSSVSCTAKTPGYCEEHYLVGKCEECDGNGPKRKSSGSFPLTKAAGQSTLSSFLKVKTKTPFLPVETGARKDKSQHPDTSSPLSSSTEESLSVSTSTAAPLSAKKSRKLSLTTVNRLITTNLATQQVRGWLVISEDKADQVVSLNCTLCKSDKLRGMKNFSTAWAFSGSTNLRLSNAEDHTRGEPRKRALDLHLKKEKCQRVPQKEHSRQLTN